MPRLRQSLYIAGFSLCVAAMLVPRRAVAQAVVVNGGAPNQGIGQNIVDDGQTATSFSIADPTTFDGIRFWGILSLDPSSPYSPDIYWQVLQDNGGLPGTAVVAGGDAVATPTFDKELDAFPGFYSWEFDVDAGPQTLGDGVYWLALHDGRVDTSPDAPLDPTAYTGSGLIWETSDAGGESAYQQFDVAPDWGETGSNEMAFDLTNSSSVVATPEPATLTLLATGFLGLAGVAPIRRRRFTRPRVELPITGNKAVSQTT